MRSNHVLFVLGFLLLVTVTSIAIVATGEVPTMGWAPAENVAAAGSGEAGGAEAAGGSPAPLPVVPVARRRVVPAEAVGVLYLVIDDGGHSLADLDAYEQFPGVFTLAVLPGLVASTEAALWAADHGHEVILHQPMEAQGGNDPGPGALFVRYTAEEVATTIRANLATVPGAVGVNNHMGSRATADESLMRYVVSQLADLHLFALDSRTVAESQFEAIAVAEGHPVAVRSIFLDNERSAAAVGAQLDLAVERARAQGAAIMIGHATSPVVAEVLSARYGELVQAGFVFRPLSDAVAARLRAQR